MVFVLGVCIWPEGTKGLGEGGEKQQQSNSHALPWLIRKVNSPPHIHPLSKQSFGKKTGCLQSWYQLPVSHVTVQLSMSKYRLASQIGCSEAANPAVEHPNSEAAKSIIWITTLHSCVYVVTSFWKVLPHLCLWKSMNSSPHSHTPGAIPCKTSLCPGTWDSFWDWPWGLNLSFLPGAAKEVCLSYISYTPLQGSSLGFKRPPKHGGTPYLIPSPHRHLQCSPQGSRGCPGP